MFLNFILKFKNIELIGLLGLSSNIYSLGKQLIFPNSVYFTSVK